MSPFIETLGAVNEVPIVTVAVAYDDPVTYQTYILTFNQVLYFKDLKVNLICPNQMRNNNVTVNECPLKFLPPDRRTPEMHAIIANDVLIPLELCGTYSAFVTRKPTLAEINDPHAHNIVLTSDVKWDPYDDLQGDDETAIRNRLDVVPYPRDRAIASTQRYDNNDPYTTLSRTVNISAAGSGHRKGTIQAADLAARWHIGLEAAKRTIERTTQLAIRDLTNRTAQRRLKPVHYQLRYRRLRCDMYTDTMFNRTTKSLNGNTCAQVFCTNFDFITVYPMRTKGDAHLALGRLLADYGAPTKMIPDNAPELIGGEFKAKLNQAGVQIRPIEAFTPNQNRAEAGIRELKRLYRRAMRATNAPAVLWDHCLELQAEIRSHTALNIYSLEGDTPYTVLTGDTPDISHLSEFAWYQYVWYLTPTDADFDKRKLGRYLGPSHDVGDAMTAKILTRSAKVVSRTSVFPLSIEDTTSEVVTKVKQEYEASIRKKLGDRMQGMPVEDNKEDNDADTPWHQFENVEGEGNEQRIIDADELDHDAYDKYINGIVYVPKGDEMVYGKVTRRKRDADGNLIGKSHPNPLLSTAVYSVAFDNGAVEAYSANIIAENLYAQVDEEGKEYCCIDEIVDHRHDATAVQADDALTTRGQPQRTTRGWQLCVRWKNGETSWVELKELKSSNPIELAEYAAANKLLHVPAFAWWASYTLKRRDRVISANQTRYLRKDQKYGLELPKTVQRALEIDQEEGNTKWRDAVKKEMSGVSIAFSYLDEGKTAPPGYQYIQCHMIFDIKMDLTRKARLVAGGHMTKPPSSLTYASVVSRESVRIAFMYASLNNLKILAADIGNAYLNAKCREKVYTTCGPEFGEYEGRVAIIVRALYGLKSSGAAWRAHLAEVLHNDLEFTATLADPDVWYKPTVRSDGTKYYMYILVYTDDILAIAEDPQAIMDKLDQHFLLKKGSVGPPTTYLGATISTYRLPDDPTKDRWSISSDKYVKEAINNVKRWVEDRGGRFHVSAKTVLSTSYRPELDVTDYCDSNDHTYYQQQVGVLRWAVELGRIDICCEVSMMAAYCAAPRVGHLEAVLHIFSYLSSHGKSKLIMDDSYAKLEEAPKQDWRDFYPDAKEAIPPNMPEPLGKPVQTTAFVDADHAGDTITRRSRTGVLIYVNRAPIIWYSKKQNSVEGATFGSEFMALKTAVEMINGLRYKLRMFGIPIEGYTLMRVDNMSVVKNASTPSSMLKKKSNSIAYHYVRENAAADVIRVAYEPTGTNLADMLTKTQSGTVRKRLSEQVMY